MATVYHTSALTLLLRFRPPPGSTPAACSLREVCVHNMASNDDVDAEEVPSIKRRSLAQWTHSAWHDLHGFEVAGAAITRTPWRLVKSPRAAQHGAERQRACWELVQGVRRGEGARFRRDRESGGSLARRSTCEPCEYYGCLIWPAASGCVPCLKFTS